MIRNQLSQDKQIESKGQKIAAALYLITDHLPEQDPIRTQLRTYAVELLDADVEVRAAIGIRIVNLLNTGMIARIISEGNVRILEAEIKYFADPAYQRDSTLSALFKTEEADKGQLLPKKTDARSTSFIPKYVREESNSVLENRNQSIKEDKNRRHEKILSFINEKKSVSVKDISALFPTVSEKTIQRELGSLVAEGKISKRGDKRWSVYMAISKA